MSFPYPPSLVWSPTLLIEKARQRVFSSFVAVSGEVKVMAKRLMIEDGLLPTIGAQGGQIEEALSKLSPEDRRATTRRFRKVYRRAISFMRKSPQGAPVDSKGEKRKRVEDWYISRAKTMVECGDEA